MDVLVGVRCNTLTGLGSLGSASAQSQDQS